MPWAVNNFLAFSPTTRDEKGDLVLELQVILLSNYLSLAAIGFLIFCPWKKGPEWYLKFSPVLFYTLMYLNYVILPLINFLLFIYFTLNPNYDLINFPLESWIVFFSIICFTRLCEFFFSLKKIVMDDARIYLQTRRLKEQGQLQQLIDSADAEAEEAEDENIDDSQPIDPDAKALRKVIVELKNDDCQSYLSRTRTYGEGEVRIGDTLTLNDDIYSIGFISQMRDDIMKKILDIATGKLTETDGEELEETVELEPATSVVKVNTRINDFHRESSEDEDVGVEQDAYEKVVQEQEMIRKFQKEFQIRKAKRLNIFLHVLLCFLCQLFLILNIFNFLISDPYQRSQFTSDVSVIILFARFICGTILHLSLIDEVSTGLENMKFCLNHPYMFQSWKQAWFVGFLQSVVVIMVETVNI